MSGYAFHPEAFADIDEIWETSRKITSKLATEYSPRSIPLSACSSHHHTSATDVQT
jgi:hypothetical protein